MRRIFGASMVAIVALALVAPTVTAREVRATWGASSGVTTFYDNEKGCEAGVTTKVDLPAWTAPFGRARLVMSHCPGDGIVSDGDLTLTMRNGDQLHGTYYGEVTPSADFLTYYASIHVQWDGAGTGRFDDAHGNATMFAIARYADGPEWPWQGAWLGWISY